MQDRKRLAKQSRAVRGVVPCAALVLGVLIFSGCASSGPTGPTPEQVSAATAQASAEGAPSSLKADYVDLLVGGERDYVQRAMEIGLKASRQGQLVFAGRVFDQAIRRVEALQAGARQAERAKSKFVAEEEKWFKGEAYERAALYLYRGIVYAVQGDWNNAAACAKRAQLQDISSREERSGDWYSADWLLALALLKMGEKESARETLARARTYANRRGIVVPPLASSNVLVIVETGAAPLKRPAGRYGQRLVFEERDSPIRTIRVEGSFEGTQDLQIQETAAAENLYFQATTRGGRKVDSILAGKANFKDATNTAGDVAIATGAVTAATGQSDAQALTGLGLILGGIISKSVSDSAQPQADVRAWRNLPNRIFLSSLQCPPGATKIRVEALDESNSILKETTQEVIPDPSQKTQPLQLLWIRF